ncbi:maleylpyruvate isomerase family mycothiol-dependent enzyme [Spongiactinospora sp. TRM90649]|uniref:maleylpyruvate isomerase family mycothiol-dependent enzyme n=1 Tax=Spongiactinospora sp. TRM90649 TaxID=3031114 RepID=UPI0023F763A3|nr:maleylpyruvate isomerase family mycothiol-dependent enzyme [Spongiactinospora sp. TRM90649]MDF5757568.1 maleylpyruvate isomerase family mycothiol-dependent enzyme [Spongiactinospora sp. TRM90649]
MTIDDQALAGLDPFDLYDAEAARLGRFFAGPGEQARDRPSRADGWSVRDVLAHLAGEELYNHACLDDDLAGMSDLLAREGVAGLDDFNDWCVRERRGVPYADVLAEWREKNGETRRRMRERGADAMLPTLAGPYPVGAQTFHYASELATHADDVGVPVSPQEAAGRTAWRVQVGRFALGERDAGVTVEPGGERVRVVADGAEAVLSASDFVEATVGRLPAGHPLDDGIVSALRCLA